MDSKKPENKYALLFKQQYMSLRQRNGFGSKATPLAEGPAKMLAPEQKKALDSALVTAAYNGDKEKVQCLLDKGADPNATTDTTWTVLMVAVWHWRYEIVEMLIQHKADVNKPDKEGWTPFMLAVKNEDTKMARLLIANGADVNVPLPR